MRLGILLGTLLGSHCLLHVTGKPSSAVTFQLAKSGSTCDDLASQCTGSKPLTDFNACRVNAKEGCKFDLTVTDTETDIAATVVKESKHAAIITINKMEPLDNLVLKSVKITGPALAGTKLVIKKAALAGAKEDVKAWTAVEGCAVQGDTFKCTGDAQISTAAPFYLAVVTAADGSPTDLKTSFSAVVTLSRAGINAIPKLSDKEAKYKLAWSRECTVTQGDACLAELPNVAAVKTCLNTHKTASCKVTPTISFVATTNIGLIETDLDAANSLPVVFIDLKGLDTAIANPSKLAVKTLNFGISADIAANAALIVTDKLDAASLAKKIAQTTVTKRGAVSGEYLTKGTHDFNKGQFVYLDKGLASGTFKPTIELNGAAIDNKPPVVPPVTKPTYTLAASNAVVDSCSPIPVECTTDGSSHKIKNIDTCITSGTTKKCKMSFTWTYNQATASKLPGSLPIVYFDTAALKIPAGVKKIQITEITVDEPALTGDCFTAASTIKSGTDFSKVQPLVGAAITKVDENKKFTTNIEATSGQYYQIQPVAGKTGCDIGAAAKMSFTVTAIVDATKTPAVDPGKTKLDEQATWTKEALTAKITDAGTGANACTFSAITDCNKALSTVESIGKCIAALKNSAVCKTKDVTFTTTLTQPKSTTIKVDSEDVAAFEIKSIKESDIHLGLSKTDGAAIPVKITKIEGKVSAAGTYELFSLTYASGKFEKGTRQGADITIAPTTPFTVNCDVALVENGVSFGLFPKTARVRRLQEGDDDSDAEVSLPVGAPSAVVITDIQVTASAKGKAQELKVTTPKVNEDSFKYELTASTAVSDAANDQSCKGLVTTNCGAASTKLTNVKACVTAVKAGKCKVNFSLTYKQKAATTLTAVDSHKSPIVYFEPEKTVTAIETTNAGFEITQIAVDGSDAKLSAECYSTGIKIFSGTVLTTAFTEVTGPTVTFDVATKAFTITNLKAEPNTYYQIRPGKAAECEITSAVTMSFTVNTSIDKRVPKVDLPKITYAVTAGDATNCETIDATKCNAINGIDQLNKCRVNAKPECLLNVNMIHMQTAIPPTKVTGEAKAIVIPLKVETLGGFKLETVNIEADGVTIPSGALLLFSETAITEHTAISGLKEVNQCTLTGQTFTCPKESATTFEAKQYWLTVVTSDKKTFIPTANSFKATITLVRNSVHPIPKFSGDEVKYGWSKQTDCVAVTTCTDDKHLTADEFKNCAKLIQKDNCKATPTVILTASAGSSPVETSLEGKEMDLAAVFVAQEVFLQGHFDLNKIKLDTVNFGIEENKIVDKAELLVNDKLINLIDGKVIDAKADNKGVVTGWTDVTHSFDGGKFMYLSKGMKDGASKFKPQVTLEGTEATLDGKTDAELTQKLKDKSTWSVEKSSWKVTPVESSCDMKNIQLCQSLTTATISQCIKTLQTTAACKEASITVEAVLTGSSVPYKLNDEGDAAVFQIKAIKDSDIHLGLTRQDKKPVAMNLVKVEGGIDQGNYDLFKLSLSNEKYRKESTSLATVTATSDGKFSTPDLTDVELSEGGITFGLFNPDGKARLRSRRLQQPALATDFHNIKDIKITAKSAAVKLSELTTSEKPNVVPVTTGAPSMLISGSLMISCATLLLSWSL